MEDRGRGGAGAAEWCGATQAGGDLADELIEGERDAGEEETSA